MEGWYSAYIERVQEEIGAYLLVDPDHTTLIEKHNERVQRKPPISLLSHQLLCVITIWMLVGMINAFCSIGSGLGPKPNEYVVLNEVSIQMFIIYIVQLLLWTGGVDYMPEIHKKFMGKVVVNLGIMHFFYAFILACLPGTVRIRVVIFLNMSIVFLVIAVYLFFAFLSLYFNMPKKEHHPKTISHTVGNGMSISVYK